MGTLQVWAVSHHSLSARAGAYGNTRLRSLPVELGSGQPCLTLERRKVMWQDGYGHADEHSATLRACLSSLSAVFWWGVLGTTNKTIHGMCGWIRFRVSSVSSYPKACLFPTGTDLARFTWFAVKARRYLRVNDPGLLKAKRRSPQQTRMHSRRWVYILQHVDTPHSRSLCGSVANCVTVLVRRLWMPDTFLQHTIEVAKTRTVARLLGFGVVWGDMCCGRDTSPVEVHNSATITCPYQEKPRA